MIEREIDIWQRDAISPTYKNDGVVFFMLFVVVGCCES